MKTVKHFKDLGLVFVVGDRCKDRFGNEYGRGGWVSEVNGDSSSRWSGDEVTKFAWRKNTGEAPEFRGEVELRGGATGAVTSWGANWQIDGSDGEILFRRPLLTQPKQQEKPIYTQEMADAKALVPVGAEYRLSNGSVYLCVAHHCKGGIIGEGSSKVMANHHHCIHDILPLKTQRDIEIDLIKELVIRVAGNVSQSQAESIHRAWRVTKVEE